MWLDVPFETLSPLIGAPPDHLKLLFSLLSAYPLAHLYVRLPSTNTKHAFSLAVAWFYMVALFGLYWGLAQLVLDSVGVWAVCKLRIERGGGKSMMPWIVFWLVMGHLTINHMYRAFASIPASEMEITAMQMVLAMKLITFAWNVEDGMHSVENTDPALLSTRLPPSEFPSIFPFLAYALFFPSLLIGPACDYTSYKSLTEGKIFAFPPGATTVSTENKRRLSSSQGTETPHQQGEDVDVKKITRDAFQHKRLLVPKGRKTVAYRKLVVGLVMLGIYTLFGSKISYERMVEEKVWWYSKSVFGRWAFMMGSGFIARTKYYAIWSISEGACILTGIGFNGYKRSKDGKVQHELWDRVQNIDIWSIESAQSFKVLFDSWNCRANVWLRDTIYKRLTPRGQKPGTQSTVMTFVTSAFWHGIAPGYYMAFVTAGICTSLGRPIRSLIRPFFLPSNQSSHSTTPKLIYDILSWLVVQSMLNYFVAAFLLLSWKDSIAGWSRLGWVGHFCIGLVWAGFKFGGKKWLTGLNKGMNKV